MRNEQPAFSQQDSHNETNLSNNLRKNYTERLYENIRLESSDLFERFKTFPERMKVIQDRIGPVLSFLSQEQQEHIRQSLHTIQSANSKDEFVEQIFQVMKYFYDARLEHLSYFEPIEREEMLKNNPQMRELNQILLYEIDGQQIRIHVPPNQGTSLKEKIRLLRDGLHKLALVVKENTEIKEVVGFSWIIEKNPGLLRKIGFEVSGVGDSMAIISREELLKRWLAV